MRHKKAASEFEISHLELKKGKTKDLSRKVVKQKGQALVGIPKAIYDRLTKIMSGEIYVDWKEAENPFAAEIHVKFFSSSPAIDKLKNRDGKSQSKNKP